MEKLQRVRNQIKAGTPSQPILRESVQQNLSSATGHSPVSATTSCTSRTATANRLVAFLHKQCCPLVLKTTTDIVCIFQQQSTVLKEDLPGFIFESNRGTKHSFSAETALGPEFAATWAARRNRKFRSKTEANKLKVNASQL